jgi:hypothetical protein
MTPIPAAAKEQAVCSPIPSVLPVTSATRRSLCDDDADVDGIEADAHLEQPFCYLGFGLKSLEFGIQDLGFRV